LSDFSSIYSPFSFVLGIQSSITLQVKHGSVYTTSGVLAGIDGTLQFVEDVYGKETADDIVRALEYDRHTNASWDPWADYYNLTDVHT
jgi:hypothetical protein